MILFVAPLSLIFQGYRCYRYVTITCLLTYLLVIDVYTVHTVMVNAYIYYLHIYLLLLKHILFILM